MCKYTIYMWWKGDLLDDCSQGSKYTGSLLHYLSHVWFGVFESLFDQSYSHSRNLSSQLNKKNERIDKGKQLTCLVSLDFSETSGLPCSGVYKYLSGFSGAR